MVMPKKKDDDEYGLKYESVTKDRRYSLPNPKRSKEPATVLLPHLCKTMRTQHQSVPETKSPDSKTKRTAVLDETTRPRTKFLHKSVTDPPANVLDTKIRKNSDEKLKSRAAFTPEIGDKTLARGKETQSNDGGKYATQGVIATKKSQESIRNDKPLVGGQIALTDVTQRTSETKSKADSSVKLPTRIRSKSLYDGDERKDIEKLRELYNQAITMVQQDDPLVIAEKRSMSMLGIKNRWHSDIRQTAVLENSTKKELEAILTDPQFQIPRKSLDAEAIRLQKKRIEHLEKILGKMSNNKENEILAPSEALRCRYLRLSKNNIETLERLLREAGKDVGIHVHSDTTKVNIWEGLKEERTDIDNATSSNRIKNRDSKL